MSSRAHHAIVGDALAILAAGLSPVLDHVVTRRLGANLSWMDLLRRKDEVRGRSHGVYSQGDLALQLRAMNERLGELGHPFATEMDRAGSGQVHELIQIRNDWAHHGEFTAQTAYRALDTAELLLRQFASAEADEINELKIKLIPELFGGDTHSSERSGPIEQAGQRARDPEVSSEARPAESPTGPELIGLEVTSVSTISYAMAHAKVPIVDEVLISAPAQDLSEATLEVVVESTSGRLSDPKVIVLDLPAGQDRTIRSIQVLLDPIRMLATDELTPGVVRATLTTTDGVVVGTTTQRIQVLAANQWVASPAQLGLEMLALHVQPNARVLESVLLDAADRLLKATGSSALDGYQSDSPERVDAIAASIFEALTATTIRYAEPPASWSLPTSVGSDDSQHKAGDGVGQKIRTPTQVVSGLGTCLDTSVTFAAALEQAGINPLIWVTRGHAFAGYWRRPGALESAANLDPAEAVNLVELGDLAVVETTHMTGASEPDSFAAALEAPKKRHIRGEAIDVLGILDVASAREAQLYPLPSQGRADDAAFVSAFAPQPRFSGSLSAKTVPGLTVGREVVLGPDRVEQWKNSLLDLGLRNRLINFTERAGYRLEVPSASTAELEDLVNSGKRITLIPSDDVTSIDRQRGARFGRDLDDETRARLLEEKSSTFVNVASEQYTKKLRYLANKTKTIIDETGANPLYLTFGMLRWTFGSRELQSPLVLVPVTLSTTNQGRRYQLTLDEAGASTPNYCLLEKLRTSFGLELPSLANPELDASGIDLAQTFESIRRSLVDRGLPFTVDESVHIGNLQFAKFKLWKDLDENWEEFEKNALVRHLIHNPLEAFEDPTTSSPREEINLERIAEEVPLSADSSQLEAVADAVAGRTYVLQGPPGTGKSQTITNLLAKAVADGRTVLFVAEKRAALDVVKQRLDEVGLGALSLDLHDKSAKPAAVRRQLRQALDLTKKDDPVALHTSREATRSSQRTLKRYADSLYEENAAGFSLHSARTAVLSADPAVSTMALPVELVTQATPQQLEMVRTSLSELPDSSYAARPRAEHPWGFLRPELRNRADPLEILASARQLETAFTAALSEGLQAEQLSAVPTGEGFAHWSAVAGAGRVPLEALRTMSTPQWQSYLSDFATSIQRTLDAPAAWRRVFSPAVLEGAVEHMAADARAADEAGFLTRSKRRREVIARVEPFLIVSADSVDLDTFGTLVAELAVAKQTTMAARAQLASIPLSLSHPTWTPFDRQDVERVRTAITFVQWMCKHLQVPDARFRRVLEHHYATTPVGHSRVQLLELSVAVRRLEASIGSSLAELATWAADGAFFGAWERSRHSRRLDDTGAEEISRWLRFATHVAALRSIGLEEVRTAAFNGSLQVDDVRQSFEQGLAAISLVERQSALGGAHFDAATHERVIQRFSTSSDAVRRELPYSIPAQALERREELLARENGALGALRRQLDRQRGGLGVRALLEQFTELIQGTTPCMLMSPESAARFLPAKANLFDIVVFDEASQVRVADAVGPMGRARSVVVVGDSKQMPPSRFAEVTSVDEEDERSSTAVVDEESILSESVQARVPSKWLSWHYRSQNEGLIAFSNRHYYDNRLTSFPGPGTSAAQSAGTPTSGVSFVKVDGTFLRGRGGGEYRTNRVEAEAIVADVLHRFSVASHDGMTPSLGIITFNLQQRDLIENLLRDSGVERVVQALDEPDGLFVKNLENVQGDERDSILFSVAFSPNEHGIVPLNFGPLSRAGGERRLNVAVTRARRQVTVYASFTPDQLRSENTTQVGTKHLKAYLEMAAYGVDAVTDDGTRSRSIDRHRDDIAEHLRSRGLVVKSDVGLSDFRIDLSLAHAEEPERSLVAVLLDGPSWRDRSTVNDRDALPRKVLGDLLKWPSVQRVWLPDWLANAEKVLSGLEQQVLDARSRSLAEEARSASPSTDTAPPAPFLDGVRGADDAVRTREISQRGGVNGSQALRSSSAPAPVSAPRSSPLPEMSLDHSQKEFSAPRVSDAKANAAQSRGTVDSDSRDVWVPTHDSDPSHLDDLPSRRARRVVQDAVVSAIEALGPISAEDLARVVGNSFGLARVHSRRQQAILDVVPTEHERKTDPGFFWPNGVDPVRWSSYRHADSSPATSLEQVSLFEVANALVTHLEATGPQESSLLLRNGLQRLGYKRLTTSAAARLEEALKLALSQGKVHVDGDTVRLVIAQRP